MSDKEEQPLLCITMPDGSEWAIKVELVARDRATYFTDKEKPGSDEQVEAFYREFNYTMTHDDEIVDWAVNNMNWSDVEKWAWQIKPAPNINFQEGWVNGPHRIVR